MLSWIEAHTVGIIFTLSVIVVALIVVRRWRPSYKMNVALLCSYVFLLVLGIALLGLNTMKAVPELADLSISNPQMGGNVLSILMLGFYLLTLIAGFMASANVIANLGIKEGKSISSLNTKLYLWTLPLFLVVLPFTKQLGSIPVYVFLVLLIALIVRNCRLMTPWWYALFIAVLGITTSISLTFLFINIAVQMTVILIVLAIIRYAFFTREGWSVLLSDRSSGGGSFSSIGSSSVTASSSSADYGTSESGYDAVISGGGVFGEDIGANRNSDGSLTDANGRQWKDNGYGHYSKEK